jgi:hypothetical protein
MYFTSGALEHLVSFFVFAFLRYIVLYITNLCKFVFEGLNKWPSNVIAGDICRVCRCEGSADKPLFHPCICTGSIKFIHQECLVQWLRYPLHTYRTSPLLKKHSVAVRSWYQCFESGILIGSGFSQVSGSGSVFGIRIQGGGEKWRMKVKKKLRNFMFWELKASSVGRPLWRPRNIKI